MVSWKASKYGDWLRFCDDHSLVEVRRHWAQYQEMDDLPQKNKQELEASFASGMKSVLKKVGSTGAPVVAAGPLSYNLLNDRKSSNIETFSEFWSSGVTARSLFSDAIDRCLNPTFVYSRAGKAFNVHYATDPIRAFHLAPYFAPTKHAMSPSKVSLTSLVQVCMAQFSAWCVSLQRRLQQRSATTIRFAVAEALAFCEALQHCRDGEDTNTGVYSQSWGGSQLDFDVGDYGSERTAPMIFDVIDTSNVTDHMGLLNILTVAVPLLKRTPSSVLHTNTLLRTKDEGPVSSGLAERACTDVSTLSLLLGVAPICHLSHFTTQSNKHLLLAGHVLGRQFQECLSWKMPWSALPGPISGIEQLQPSMLACADPRRLAQFLFNLYLKMFTDEDQFENMKQIGNSSRLRTMNHRSYIRTSFVSLLQIIQPRVDANWNEVMRHFLELVRFDHTLLIGAHSYQELACHLHLRNILALDVLHPDWSRVVKSPSNRFRNWKGDVPPVVCVVLKVPRQSLKALEDIDDSEIGTPPLQCESSDNNFHNIHSSIRPIFGMLDVTQVNGELQAILTEDPQGWNGNSPLLVSFYMPSWLLTIAPKTTKIGLHLRNTPATLAFMPKLGMSLAIFSAYLADEDHVHILRQRPDNIRELSQLRKPMVPVMRNTNVTTERVIIDFDADVPTVG
ncbi:unnamed protein product [Cyclocybe aegerita]|uniref:Uncharacterized protein n=1 Tax=Cyclocybe aegerita TaxID=1973307 RepID=A0A8S0VQA8_CYCAE|nr:unnamed protein product [Cyclocybe aegerita]